MTASLGGVRHFAYTCPAQTPSSYLGRSPKVANLSARWSMRRGFVPAGPNSSLYDAMPQPAALLKRRLEIYTSACGLRLRADAERDGKRSDAPSGAGET